MGRRVVTLEVVDGYLYLSPALRVWVEQDGRLYAERNDGEGWTYLYLDDTYQALESAMVVLLGKDRPTWPEGERWAVRYDGNTEQVH